MLAKRNLAESLRARARILEESADLRSPGINDGSRSSVIPDPVPDAVIGAQQALRQVDANITKYRGQMDYAEWLLSLAEDPNHKEVLRLRFFEGKSAERAAAIMSVAPATMKKYTQQAWEAIAFTVNSRKYIPT